jgi:Spx/MgsR family transcriptional regulator
MKPVIYGIPTCDSVRKARKWFEAESIEYGFIDFRNQAPTREQIEMWLEALGKNALINKRSTTWKQLSETERNEVEHGDSIATLLAQPTLIKRPLLEYGGETAVGFSAKDYATRFGC